MVELQLEKLSPIPVTQALWTMQVLPHSAGEMQTVIVVIVSRNVVEEFLGHLEAQGFMADRLELPLLDQLQATPITEDGAWIYPAQSGSNTALVAWWYGGVLQNLALLVLPPKGNRAASMKEQLVQMAWAGELEGWLTSPPRWHLVAPAGNSGEWGNLLPEGGEQSLQIVPPLSETELAARTARRAAQTDPKDNLLPLEFATRYHQQFVDRLWMRGLFAVLALYGVCLLIFFVAVGVLNFRTKRVESYVASRAAAYTNVVELKARYNILKDRQELKFAALDCWEAVAEVMPATLTLDSMSFGDGRRVTLVGSGSEPGEVIDFSDKLSKYVVRGQPLFNRAKYEPPRITGNPSGGTVRWSYELELKRTEKR
jgi:hypothetical protein